MGPLRNATREEVKEEEEVLEGGKVGRNLGLRPHTDTI